MEFTTKTDACKKKASIVLTLRPHLKRGVKAGGGPLDDKSLLLHKLFFVIEPLHQDIMSLQQKSLLLLEGNIFWHHKLKLLQENWPSTWDWIDLSAFPLGAQWPKNTRISYVIKIPHQYHFATTRMRLFSHLSGVDCIFPLLFSGIRSL